MSVVETGRIGMERKYSSGGGRLGMWAGLVCVAAITGARQWRVLARGSSAGYHAHWSARMQL